MYISQQLVSALMTFMSYMYLQADMLLLILTTLPNVNTC